MQWHKTRTLGLDDALPWAMDHGDTALRSKLDHSSQAKLDRKPLNMNVLRPIMIVPGDTSRSISRGLSVEEKRFLTVYWLDS